MVYRDTGLGVRTFNDMILENSFIDLIDLEALQNFIITCISCRYPAEQNYLDLRVFGHSKQPLFVGFIRLKSRLVYPPIVSKSWRFSSVNMTI